MASRVTVTRSSEKKADAARRIASLIEEHMTECGLSEREKNRRVRQFGKRVDRAIQRPAKRA